MRRFPLRLTAHDFHRVFLHAFAVHAAKDARRAFMNALLGRYGQSIRIEAVFHRGFAAAVNAELIVDRNITERPVFLEKRALDLTRLAFLAAHHADHLRLKHLAFAHGQEFARIHIRHRMAQRAVRPAFRIVKRKRAHTGRTVAHPYAQMVFAVERVLDRAHVQRQQLLLAHHLHVHIRAAVQAHQLRQMLGIHHRFTRVHRNHVARAHAGRLGRVLICARKIRHAHHQHAAGMQLHADELPAGNQPFGVCRAAQRQQKRCAEPDPEKGILRRRGVSQCRRPCLCRR